MKIKLNAETGKKLIYFQIIYNLIIKFAITVIGIPSFFNYVTDVVTILLYLCCHKRIQRTLREASFQEFRILILIYWVILSLTSLFNFVSPFLYIWAFRNTFRFLFFAEACIVCLEKADIDHIFDILVRFNYLNIVLSLYEYFVLGYSRDFLGGMFGTERGCNGALNLYFCIILIWVVINYTNKKINFFVLAITVISSLGIATLAELKIFYIEFIIIVALSVFLSKPSFRNGLIIVGSIFGVVFALRLLAQLFPLHYAVLTSSSNILSYFDAAGTGGYNISRMHAFQDINNMFFHNNPLRNLFGFGFGSCEYSSVPIFISDFYKQNSTLNYRIFSHSMIFLETGYVGFIGFIIILVYPIIFIIRYAKKYNIEKLYSNVVFISVMILIISLWYNNSIKIEYAYMAYCILAIIPVLIKEEKAACKSTVV